MKRPNWFQVSDKGGKAIAALHHYATTGTGLPAELIHLIFLRVSQINGCAHCIDIYILAILSRVACPSKRLYWCPSGEKLPIYSRI
ncbi:carboxymuconolactone decarboxylase family protein [Klebsiella pneumoniae subsp. pneumoniae]|nr:carboxymuconolactone decarboxylase family protein [Klebsiella pneumoniae subsp. pneumoniae]